MGGWSINLVGQCPFSLVGIDFSPHDLSMVMFLVLVVVVLYGHTYGDCLGLGHGHDDGRDHE